MKKTFTLIRLLIATALLSAAFSFAALAVTINEVNFTAYLDEEDYEIERGDEAVVIDPAFMITYGTDMGYFELSDYHTVDDAEHYNAYTYELVFHALDDYRFNRTASYITVTGQRIESITNRTVSNNGRTLRVRVRAYPYVRLPRTTGFLDTEEKRIDLEKGDGVSRVEYYIVYKDFDGDIETVHGSTSSRYISVSSYIRERTSNGETQTREVTGYHLRSASASSTSNPYIVPSIWESEGDLPDEDLMDYDYWDLYLGNSSTSSSDSSQGAVTSPGTNVSTVQGSWVQSGNDWYFRNSDSSLATGWIQVDDYWYYLDQTNGRMLTGWFTDTDGHRYYLNPNTGGPLGSMVTGWMQDSEGNWYYLNPNTGGPKGSLATGWILDGENWYYCDAANGGRMVTGWFTDTDGQRYYLNPYTGGPRGSMLIGWHMLDGRWYFFRRSAAAGQGSLGAAIIGRQVSIDGIVYTFDASGAMIETL